MSQRSSRTLLAVVLAPLLAVSVVVGAGPATATVAAPAIAQATGQPSAIPSFEDKVVKIVNKRRHKAGCRRLKSNEALRAAARTHSTGMATMDLMTHNLPGEASLGDRIEAAGYKWRRIGENVAFGQASPKAVVKSWMGSSVHRKNILNCKFRHIGVGAITYNGVMWWTQDFGRR